MGRSDWTRVAVAMLLFSGCGEGVMPNEPGSMSPGPAHYPTAGLEGTSDHVFDPEAVRHFDMRVDAAEWAQIRAFPVQEQYIEGALEYGGDVYEHVGLRFKGFRGSLYNCFLCCSITDTRAECPGPEQACYDDEGMVADNQCEQMSYKLSFTKFSPKPAFFTLRRLNFHNTSGDASLMRERLAYHLLRRGGLAAPRAVHATLSVNGEPLGIFTLVEQVDKRFAQYRFDDGGGGNVYKERWPSLSTDPAYYRSGLRSNEGPDADVSSIVAFAEALADATVDDIGEILERHADVDALARYLAVGPAIGHWDGPLTFRCNHEDSLITLPPDIADAQRPPLGHEVCQNKNFYLYERSDDGRIVVVPWDVDNALGPSFFGTRTPWYTEPEFCSFGHWGRAAGCDPLVRLLAITLRERVIEHGEAFLAHELTEAAVMPALRDWEALLAPHAMELDGVDADALRAGVDGLLTTVATRRALYRAELDGLAAVAEP